LRGGRLSPTFGELPFAKFEGGNNKDCKFVSLSSIDTSIVDTGPEFDIAGESLYGEGLNGGNESKEKNAGCDKDREWVGLGAKF
jgi:hypothetical protein